MRRDGIALLIGFAAGCSPARAAPIPEALRIPARVASRLTTPRTQPMHMPTDVALSDTGRVYVADGTNDRIVAFSADGTLSAVMTRIGSEALRRPVGVAVDGKDRLWIADTGNQRLLVAAGDGTLAQRIDLPAGSHPCDPTDVAVAHDGRIVYVVDNDNHRLLVRAGDQASFDILGGPGRAVGEFQYPFLIAVTDDGTAHVTEAIGARVQKITASREWAGQIGRWGIEPGQLYRPKGVALDAAGRIFVSDSTLGVVQVFSARGRVLGVLTEHDGSPLRFAHPMGMAFGPANRLYVVELRADAVAVVELAAGDPATPGAPDDTSGAVR